MSDTTQRFSVTDTAFGAIGDGVHDDTAAILKCVRHLESVVAKENTSVFFPPGTYLIDSATGISLFDGCVLEGAGDESIIKTGAEAPASGRVAFLVPQDANVTAKCLRLTAPTDPNSQTIKAISAETAPTSGTVTLKLIEVSSDVTATVVTGSNVLIYRSQLVRVTSGPANITGLEVDNPAGTSVFIYRPAGTAAGNVYTDWETIVAAINSVEGWRRLQFDDLGNEGVAMVIPAGGPYNMKDVVWFANRHGQGAQTQTLVHIAEGCTFTKLRHFEGNIKIESLADTTVPDSSLADKDVIFLRDGAQIENDITPGAQPIWNAVNVLSGERFTVFVEDAVLDGGGEIIHLPNSGSEVRINLTSGGSMLNRVISGVAGSTVWPFTNDSSFWSISQPNFLGTYIDYPIHNPRMLPDQAVTAGNLTVANNQVARFDTTASNRVANLPTAARNRGLTIVIVNETGGNAVVVTPDGTDTVDGAASINVTSLGAMTVVSDGIDNWIVVSTR